MSTHISEDIPRLLTGEADRVTVLAAAEHLRGCPDCQHDLVSAVVSHAALTSARRFAAEVVLGTDPSTVEPDAGRSATTRTRPVRQSGAVVGTAPSSASTAVTLPDLSDVFATVRQEASAATAKPRRRGQLAAVAAAAAVVAASGGVAAVTLAHHHDQPSTRTVALAAYDIGKHPATIKIRGNQTLQVDASALPRPDAHHFYELWLTAGPKDAPQPVGQIGDDNTAQLTVSPKVLGHYNAFQVSVQRTGQTQFSGTSVLRGAYE